MDKRKLDEHGTRLLAIAVLENAVEAIKSEEKTERAFYDALHAASWLGEVGIVWLDALNVEYSHQALQDWIDLQTTRRLSQMASEVDYAPDDPGR